MHKNTQLTNATKIIEKVCKDTKFKQLKIIGNNNHYKANMHSEVRMPIEINTKPTSDWRMQRDAFIIVTQVQSLFTRNYKANIIKDNSDLICRLCKHVEINWTLNVWLSNPYIVATQIDMIRLGCIFSGRYVNITVRHLLLFFGTIASIQKDILMLIYIIIKNSTKIPSLIYDNAVKEYDKYNDLQIVIEKIHLLKRVLLM